MKEKKRLEIKFETHELTIVRFGRNRAVAYCALCRVHTPHLSVAESVSVLALTEKEIFRLAESGRIHSRETADGWLRLCADSMAALGQNNKE
jgi:hypothetical protein